MTSTWNTKASDNLSKNNFIVDPFIPFDDCNIATYSCVIPNYISFVIKCFKEIQTIQEFYINRYEVVLCDELIYILCNNLMCFGNYHFDLPIHTKTIKDLKSPLLQYRIFKCGKNVPSTNLAKIEQLLNQNELCVIYNKMAYENRFENILSTNCVKHLKNIIKNFKSLTSWKRNNPKESMLPQNTTVCSAEDSVLLARTLKVDDKQRYDSVYKSECCVRSGRKDATNNSNEACTSTSTDTGSIDMKATAAEQLVRSNSTSSSTDTENTKLMPFTETTKTKTFSQRLASFDKCKLAIHPSKVTLAKQGYWFDSLNNAIVCYLCNDILRDDKELNHCCGQEEEKLDKSKDVSEIPNFQQPLPKSKYITLHKETSDLNYNSVRTRRKSLKGLPFKVADVILSGKGFYYENTIQCIHCDFSMKPDLVKAGKQVIERHSHYTCPASKEHTSKPIGNIKNERIDLKEKQTQPIDKSSDNINDNNEAPAVSEIENDNDEVSSVSEIENDDEELLVTDVIDTIEPEHLETENINKTDKDGIFPDYWLDYGRQLSMSPELFGRFVNSYSENPFEKFTDLMEALVKVESSEIWGIKEEKMETERTEAEIKLRENVKSNRRRINFNRKKRSSHNASTILCSDTLKELNTEYERLTESMKCKKCFEGEANVVILNCGHLSSCSVCFPSLKHCPICRSDITNFVTLP